MSRKTALVSLPYAKRTSTGVEASDASSTASTVRIGRSSRTMASAFCSSRCPNQSRPEEAVTDGADGATA